MVASRRKKGSKRRSPASSPPPKANQTGGSSSVPKSEPPAEGVPEFGGDPAVTPAGWKRPALNLWIGALLFLFSVDALPNSIPGLKRLNDGIDIVVDKLGLAQGEWKLFSPDPDHVNAYVEAIVTYDDGSTRIWTTNEWRGRSLLDKFFQGRHPKFSDAFRMDRNKAIWPRLADWILTQVDPPAGAKPKKVELKRHWWDVPVPADLHKDEAKFEHIPPHREEYENEFSFYTKEYP